MGSHPWDPSLSDRDPGLQPERTALAWQRTALSMAAAAAIVARLTVGRLGVITLIVLAFCLAHAAVLFRNSRRRYDARTGAASHQPRAVGVHGALLGLQVILLAMLELLSIASG